MANLNDHASRFRKGLSNPFDFIGLEYCPTCKMDVDTETVSRHQGTTYAYRRRCRRCGGVTSRGVFDNVATLNGQPLPAVAMQWTLKRGQDHR